MALVIFAFAALSGCEQNSFVPPPPPKVDIAIPVQRTITRFLEATGNTAAINSVDLVARVQGVLQSINYQDGDFVKAGTTLFTIEPDTYKFKLEQAQAAEAGAQASLKQAEADFKRQSDLVARQAVSQATLDQSTSSRDNAQANVQQAEANTRIAAVNYGYTKVAAPFDGIVSAHLVSVGELVGVASPTQLATIVQYDPIYVNFSVNEQQVLRIRAEAGRRGLTTSDLKQFPIEVGLQTESGYPHKGKLDYAAPTINQSTGTLAVRGILPNADRILLPGYFVRVRVPLDEQQGALLVPDVALGSDQAGRYVLVVNKDDVVEQRKVQTGPVEGDLRVIESGIKPDDRVVVAGLLRAIPGQKVDPQLQKIEIAGVADQIGAAMISKFFIERPVLSNVIAILMILIGGVALFNLAVAQYPDVVPPTVQVTTRYPGAGAKTVMDTVALPIEQQVNGVEDMLYMQSYSGADGTYTLTVTFKIGTDLNFAQVLVQNRVSSALSSLPQSVQNQGVTVQKKSTSILLFVTLTSPKGTYDSLYLSNYATINLRDELSRLPGVGNVTVFGAGQYSMRIWLDPNKLQVRGLMPQDVIQAIQQQSQQVTAGQVGAPPTPPGQAFQYTLNINGRLDDVSQFEDVIVKTGNNGDVTRVRDVGRVELGAQTYSQLFSLNKQPATGIGVFQSPGANALEVEQAVQKKMAALAASFPQDVKYDTPFDTTKFVSASIDEVYKTLIEAGLLVLIVILIFLQDWRAMLVPATTVPVTIIGAFAAMAALGFTVNLSTLFAIVLAIGIVVDDAIVVVEGAAHNIEKGMSGHDAAVSAMDALFAPIIGITLVLISVFLPAAFLPGMTGRIYAQFALVIAATALLSAINAATLKPTQCALWLRPPVPLEQRNWFYRGFNAVYARLESSYTRLIGRMVAHSNVSVIVALILIGIGGYGLSRVPTGFIPIEDQGYLLAAVQLPDGASLNRTQRVLDQVSEIAGKTAGVEQVISIAGISALETRVRALPMPVSPI